MSRDTTSLVESALAGDAPSWGLLVENHSGLVWSVIRGLNIQEPESSDVFQTVFLRLTENLPKIKPVTLPAWLITVTRRACYDVARTRQRQPIPTEHLDLSGASPGAGPEEVVELAEEESAVLAGLERLSTSCQQLLRLLSSVDEISYAQISEILEIPVGSIGPTRSRCLEKLRATPEVRLLHATANWDLS